MSPEETDEIVPVSSGTVTARKGQGVQGKELFGTLGIPWEVDPGPKVVFVKIFSWLKM